MTKSHRAPAVCIFSAGFGLLLLNGCGPAKTQQFRSSFFPPAPRITDTTQPELLSTDSQAPSAYVKELPQVTAITPVLANSEVDNRLHRAEERFEAGRRAYQEGRYDDARREFNQAVDILLRTPEGAVDRSKLEKRLDKMVDAIYRYDVNGMGAGEEADKVVYDKAPVDDLLEMTFPMDPRLKPKVKEEVFATASQLPLEESDAVISYIHFFSSDRGKRILTAGLRRAGRYRPLIQRVLDEEGVPQELIYLAQAESGFLPRAMSYKSAVGMWQFLSWRGQQYGLQVTKLTDDRLDPEKSTRAAARHLRDLYTQFGDWYLAMAAYNCGPGCVDRAVQRTGYADFFTLRNLNVLPMQTANYVPAILAITIMAKNAKDYGLDGLETDPAIEYETMKVEAPTSVALVADAVERPVSEIRELNPALLKGIAPQGYELRIPKGSSPTLSAALDAVPAARRASWRLHRVERGESLADIAKRFRTPASAIASVNKASMAAPEAGDLLLIPAAYQEPATSFTARGKRGSASSKRGTAASAQHRPARVAAQPVSSKVLHRKAQPRRVRTASVGNAG